MLALKLSHLEKNINTTHTEIDGIPPDHDVFTFKKNFSLLVVYSDLKYVYKVLINLGLL